jgi:glyoxylase-like metal-dependent hydrolase (beta-lactamase superfamily II)
MRVLFAGDALSVVNGAPELSPETGGRGSEREQASESMRRCLALEPEILLPAHGRPLLSGRRKN